MNAAIRSRTIATSLLVAVTMTLTPLAGSADQEPAGEGLDSIDLSGLSKNADIPLSDGALRALVADATPDAGNGVALDGLVRVEIHHDLDSEAVVDVVAAMGGTFEGSIPGTVQASVPADRLVELDAVEGVRFLRAPLRVDVPAAATEPVGGPDAAIEPALGGAYVGQQVAKTNADAWHAVGITGSGVKVGIIDSFHGDLWRAAQDAGEVPGVTGSMCVVNGTACDIFGAGSTHGNMVAEVIHEMAPGALIYLGSAVTVTDLGSVVAYFESQGVDIITRSLTAQYDGPGDGRGPIGSVVDDAVSAGMAWFNSAGNNAGSGQIQAGSINPGAGTYWRGTWTPGGTVEFDGALREIMQFGPGRNTLFFVCGGLVNGVRWSDWDAELPTDYDVFVFRQGELIAQSISDQSAGAPPLEVFNIDCQSGEVLELLILKYSDGNGASGDILEFLMNGGGFEFWQNPGSASGPVADSANPGMMTVGAVDPATGTAIGPYSSWGPTNDGRLKPNISAPACLTSYTAATVNQTCSTGPVGFDGTSAATPVVAGAAALVLEAGIAVTPGPLVSWLQDNATVERGSPGPDTIYGHGELQLPPPPLPPIEFVDVAADSVFAEDIAWLAASGITKGCNPPVNNLFCPQADVTRGQMAAFLVRALGLTGSGPVFADTQGHVFSGDIGRLAAAEITKGCNPPVNDRFCPDDPVTRGQMAAFLVRALGLTGSGPSFSDTGGHVFASDIGRLAAAGITKGCNPPVNDRFCPDDPVTREQMAAFLRRALAP